MSYNYFVTDSRPIHTKKLCSRLPSGEMHFFDRKRPFYVLSPLGGLGATYAVHLRLIYLLSVTIHFFSGVTAEAL